MRPLDTNSLEAKPGTILCYAPFCLKRPTDGSSLRIGCGRPDNATPLLSGPPRGLDRSGSERLGPSPSAVPASQTVHSDEHIGMVTWRKKTCLVKGKSSSFRDHDINFR